MIKANEKVFEENYFLNRRVGLGIIIDLINKVK